MKLKRLVLLLAVVMLMSLVTGCVQFQVDLELNSDNTGKLSAATAYNVDVLGEDDMSDTDTDVDLLEDLDGYEGANVVQIPLEYQVDGQTYKGEKVEISFDDTTKFFTDVYADSGEMQLIDLGDGKVRMEIPFDSESDLETETAELTEDDLQMFNMIKAMGGKIEFTVKTDYLVSNHNADKFENNVYTWDLLSRMMEGDTESAFIEYSTSKTEQPQEPVKSEKRVVTEKKLGLVKNDKDFHGNALNKLSILKGSDNGLELDKGLTRAEGAVMYARLLGVEEEINKFAEENPTYDTGFTDVPDWVKPTINYLYYNKLIAGVGNNKYGSSDLMTETQYSTLVLRALGYNDANGDFNWATANEKVKEVGLYTEDIVKPEIVLGNNFTRRGMSYISYNALFFENQQTGEVLIDKLLK